MGQVFVGHDWAEAHHDVHVEDDQGQRLAKARLPEGVEGVARFRQLVADLVDEPGEVTIATETDRGLFVGALVAAGYRVLAVNPMSTSRYRERHSTSGAKSDPGDAFVLAELARLDGHNHQPIAGDSDLAEAIKVLARAHQSLIWTRQRQAQPTPVHAAGVLPGSPRRVRRAAFGRRAGRVGNRPDPDPRSGAIAFEDRGCVATRRSATPDRRTSRRNPDCIADRASSKPRRSSLTPWARPSPRSSPSLPS